MANLLVEAARKRLFGERQIGLTPRQVRRNVRLGEQRDESWPGNAVGFNPTARALREASEKAE